MWKEGEAAVETKEEIFSVLSFCKCCVRKRIERIFLWYFFSTKSLLGVFGVWVCELQLYGRNPSDEPRKFCVVPIFSFVCS